MLVYVPRIYFDKIKESYILRNVLSFYCMPHENIPARSLDGEVGRIDSIMTYLLPFIFAQLPKDMDK